VDNTTAIIPALSLVHAKIEKGVPAHKYLLTGKLGLVLYYFSLYEAEEKEEYADTCINLLQEVMDEEDEQMPPFFGTGFASGTAGLGYILSLLQKKGVVEIDLQEELQELDETIFKAAMQQISTDERMDYLHGGLGAVHYFLLRADEPSIRIYLEQLAGAICSKAVQTPGGSWFRNFIINEQEKARIDLSLSHGNAGFLLLLLKMLEEGICTNELTPLIEEGIRFIISRRIPSAERKDTYSQFPFTINSADYSDIYTAARLAWCYGDLNIAWLLYRAAAILQVPAWKELATEIVLDTISRKDAASTMAVDSHFCHGTSGLAYFYKTIYDVTGDAGIKEAAEYWLNETLRHLGQEIANGYYADKETDLLNGLPGVNLVLLSFSTDKELAWGRAFLL
jgi:lantibiotic biosynthesis protein